MTRKELLELKRSSFLALKAFYVASMEPEFSARMNMAAMAAAQGLHKACCEELLDLAVVYHDQLITERLEPIRDRLFDVQAANPADQDIISETIRDLTEVLNLPKGGIS